MDSFLEIVKTLKTIALFRIPHTDRRLQDVAPIALTQISKRFTTNFMAPCTL
jgi:hypothetical protein